MSRVHSYLILILVCCLGCESSNETASETATGPSQTIQVPESSPQPDRESVTETPVESGNLLPPDDPLLRQRRRMDVKQLSQAIQDVTGGIAWTSNGDGTGRDLFEDLAPTLGEADFIFRTEHELDPSPVFQKYLKDAATSVCTHLAQHDPNQPPENRVLFKHVQISDTPDSNPEDWEKNLSYLLLRYHGRQLTPNSSELEPWRWLARGTYHGTESTSSAWRTLCVGLIVHPDFYTY